MSDVALATFGSTWIAAWKSSDSTLKTLHVRTGSTEWTIGPYFAGPSPTRPALVVLDATHVLAVVRGIEVLYRYDDADPDASSPAAACDASLLKDRYGSELELDRRRRLVRTHSRVGGPRRKERDPFLRWCFGPGPPAVYPRRPYAEHLSVERHDRLAFPARTSRRLVGLLEGRVSLGRSPQGAIFMKLERVPATR